MSRLALAVALATTAAFGFAGCGMRGDPLPPLRKTPPPIADLVVSQEGDRIVLDFSVPGASIDGVPLRETKLEILTAGAEGDFRKVARRRTIRARGGERVHESEPLPAVGFPYRVVVLGRSGNPSGALPTPIVVVPIAPPAAPRNLRAQPVDGGIRLRWAGDIPAAPPLPAPSPLPAATASPISPALPTSALDRGNVKAVQPLAPPPAAQGTHPLVPPSSSAAAADATALARGAAFPPVLQPASPPPPAPVNPGFRVYRRTPPSTRSMPLVREPQADRTLVDATATEGSEWCYVVRAVAGLDPVRESASSNEVCLVVPPAATQATP